MTTKKLCGKCFPIPVVVRGYDWNVDDRGRGVGAVHRPDGACGVARCELEQGHEGDHKAKMTVNLEWPDYASVDEKDWVK